MAAAFPAPETAVTREALLVACNSNVAELNQIIDRQGVLPKDFWSPDTYYTLDPELFLLHPSAAQTFAQR